MVTYRRQALAGLLVAFQIIWVAPAAQAPAPLQVTIVEWDVPQGKLSFVPHDPDVAPDGGAWYTGYGANVLGRVDPSSGLVKEFSLPTADSGPHGLTIDPQGHVWYTGNRAALIGRLDPTTGKVTEYPMPDPQARDPHTPILGKNGILWFTVQSGNYVGRLDTASGAVTLKQVATPKAMPHGIVLTRADDPFFALSGTNKIGRIDPQSMDIKEFILPEGARPRRLAVAAGDFIWYGDSARGMLGRLDPNTGSVKEWATPGGPKSAPWGVASTPDGAIWYSESGVTPNTVVRFDPVTETTQSWPIPSGGGVVRHMVASRDGSLWLACSGVGKVAHVRVSASSRR